MLTRLMYIVTMGAAAVLTVYSVAAGDWRTVVMTGIVILGLVAYRRGWIRRFGR